MIYPSRHPRRYERSFVVSFSDFPSILPSLGRPLGRTYVLKHQMMLEQGVKPVYIPDYRFPHSRRAYFEEETNKLLAQLCPLRPIVDYRKLNTVTVPDHCPIPNSAYYFLLNRLAVRFYEIEMHDDRRTWQIFQLAMGISLSSKYPLAYEIPPLFLVD